MPNIIPREKKAKSYVGNSQRLLLPNYHAKLRVPDLGPNKHINEKRARVINCDELSTLPSGSCEKYCLRNK